MQQLILQQVKNELINGSVKRGHPFKYFAFGATETGNPTLRTVVLRKVLPGMHLVFYTDQRSNKVQQILNNPNVSALFYHPRKLMQVQLQGTARIVTDPETLAQIWKVIPTNSRKDYTTQVAPGTEIKAPDEVEYLSASNHFCMVEIIPTTIEYLRLKRPNHIRVRFVRENDVWQGKFLVP